MEVTGKKIGFVLTDCLCNFEKILPQMKILKKLGADLLPIVDDFTSNFEKDIEQICEKKILHTIEDVKQIGSNQLSDIIIVAPASEITISKLVCDIIDTPALIAVKTHLRNELPIVIAISSQDGLGSNMNNIATLINRKNYYFVPFKQSNPITKPRSIIFDADYILKTVQAALDGNQIQPILL